MNSTLSVKKIQDCTSIPIWILALVTLSGTLAMHIFVPALPQVAAELQTSINSVQFTISVYIFGLAIGQLFYGPLSDRFGRRPILLIGISIFMLANLSAIFVHNIHLLIVERLLQALGGCSGLVLARAIVRDVSTDASDSIKRQATMNLMVTLGPLIAPLLGALFVSAAGWRFLFVFLTILGMLNFWLVWRRVPETSSLEFDAKKILPGYRKLLTNPAFLCYSIAGGCATTSVYAFIAAAPFILMDHNYHDSHWSGICLSILVSGIWIGSLLTTRLLHKVTNRDDYLMKANTLGLLSAILFLLFVLVAHLPVFFMLGCMFFYAVGTGMAAPTALTQAVNVNPDIVGSASGLYGFIQMSVGALCTSLIGFGSNQALTVAIVLTLACLLARFLLKIVIRKKTVHQLRTMNE